MARTLTDKEYAKLAVKLDVVGPEAQPAAIQHAVNHLKQAHRLLCDGHKVEDLTPAEQFYASAFKGGTCVQIPSDYGWEPGVEVEPESEPETETVKTAPPPKPKKNGK